MTCNVFFAPKVDGSTLITVPSYLNLKQLKRKDTGVYSVNGINGYENRSCNQNLEYSALCQRERVYQSAKVHLFDNPDSSS